MSSTSRSDSTVRSADGTSIAYTRRGTGPVVILIDGALCHRGMGPSSALGGLLAESGFTTYTYDRRGREPAATPGPTPWRARSRTSPR